MWYLEISFIIIVVVACVHIVHKYAYNQGIKNGIENGRMEILKENIVRSEYQHKSVESELDKLAC